MIYTRSRSWVVTARAELRPPNPEPSILAILLEFLYPHYEQDARKSSIPNSLLFSLPLLSAHRSILLECTLPQSSLPGSGSHLPTGVQGMGMDATMSTLRRNASFPPRIPVPSRPLFPPIFQVVLRYQLLYSKHEACIRTKPFS